MSNKFEEDLKFGNKFERIYGAYLQMSGAKKLEYNNDAKYDISCEFGGIKTTFEVKTDRYVSDNIVIEWFCNKRLKPTGVLATEADYFVCIFTEDQEIWSIKTEKLIKVLFKSNMFFPVVRGGDDKMVTMFKIHKDTLRQHFLIKPLKITKIEKDEK